MALALDTLREPATLRGPSCTGVLAGIGTVPVGLGLSASRSRLLELAGPDCGSGKSPTDASSHRTSLRGKLNSLHIGGKINMPTRGGLQNAT